MIQRRRAGYLAVWAIAGLLLTGCSTSPATNPSNDNGYYVVNPDGQVYKDSKGNCWHVTTRDKTAGDKRVECGDQVATSPTDSDGDGVPDSRDRCPNTPAGAQVDADGCRIQAEAPIVLKGVTFQFDSAQLTPQAEDRLDNVVNALKASPDLRFRMDGYTDGIGTEAYNQDLSQQRVDSVRQYLIDNGIDPTRITATQGHGEADPVAGNDTDAGRAQNRRVELGVTSQ